MPYYLFFVFFPCFCLFFFFFVGSLFIFSLPPLQRAPDLLFSAPYLFLLLSLLSTLSLSLRPAFFGFGSMEDREFGGSKQNNLPSAFIISGISGTGQSAERDRPKQSQDYCVRVCVLQRSERGSLNKFIHKKRNTFTK